VIRGVRWWRASKTATWSLVDHFAKLRVVLTGQERAHGLMNIDFSHARVEKRPRVVSPTAGDGLSESSSPVKWHAS
jgi:hypothetical protein